ncbi:MAG: MoaD/ThiS family protein [Desulfovibrionales bacterium]
MQIHIKCFATLAEYGPRDGTIEVPEGITLQGVMEQLNMPQEEVKLLFVNGKRADSKSVLHSGDRVGLFPPVGGG